MYCSLGCLLGFLRVVGFCRVEITHLLNFLIPLISMNLTNEVNLPNGHKMPSVSCGDWSVCNAAPAFMMITVTIIGVATTLFKEALALVFLSIDV